MSEQIPRVQIEHDHFPEAAEDGRGIRRLELIGAKEELGSSTERRKLFSELDYETFKKMSGYINSITRGQKLEYEYENGQIPMEPTPTLEDKEPLMKLALESVQEILQDEELADDEALRLAGLTIAGAINYIHPYENGNGRTGRVFHYLIEYGTERGEEAFGVELGAIIGKHPLLDSDWAKAINNTPPAELGRSLLSALDAENGANWRSEISEEAVASASVVAFLDMMKGGLDVPITEKTLVYDVVSNNKIDTPVIRHEPNEIDGRELYIEEYLHNSTVPNREFGEVPEGSARQRGFRGERKPKRIIKRPVDHV